MIAGLSNGSYGAAQLALRLKGTFAGLVLISGGDADVAGAGVPTLVVHGSRDTVAAYSTSLAYAKKTGATLLTLDAGHHAMLVKSDAFARGLPSS